MSNEKILAVLDNISHSVKLMRDHADELYKLIPDSKDKESAEYKGKRAAGWHGHEVNKYMMHVNRRVTELKELM